MDLWYPEPIEQNSRWLELLEEYNFDITRQLGTQHGNCQCLSRRPCTQSGTKEDDTSNTCAIHLSFTPLQSEWLTLCQVVQLYIEFVLNLDAWLICGGARFDHVSDVMRDTLYWLPVPQRI